jgi:methylphosphotriester-DNA--protein-cysteine methyltransferase
MGQPPNAKPKRKSQKGTDKKQSARFIAAARKLGFESTDDFEDNFKKIVQPKTRKS